MNRQRYRTPVLPRIAPPINHDNPNKAAMTNGDKFPTTEASNDAQIKNPLPMIDASGVTVARQFRCAESPA